VYNYDKTNRNASFFCCNVDSISCVRPAALERGNVTGSSGSTEVSFSANDAGFVALWTSQLTAVTPAFSEDCGGFELRRCPANRWAWVCASSGLWHSTAAVTGLTNKHILAIHMVVIIIIIIIISHLQACGNHFSTKGSRTKTPVWHKWGINFLNPSKILGVSWPPDPDLPWPCSPLSATRSQQPPEQAILLQSMWDCGTQGHLGLSSSMWSEQGRGKSGSGVNWPLKFEIGVKNWHLPYVEQVIFDLDPMLKNGSSAPGSEGVCCGWCICVQV